MQAFAISVVLMSSACGEIAAPMPNHQQRNLAAVVRGSDSQPQRKPYVASFAGERYDSGKGDFHVAPLSSRGGAASGRL